MRSINKTEGRSGKFLRNPAFDAPATAMAENLGKAKAVFHQPKLV